MINEKKKEAIRKSLATNLWVRWLMLFLVMAVFSVILYPNLLLTEHVYEVGDIAEGDIKAPRDFFIEDSQATRTLRHEAAEKILTVYDYNAGLADNLSRRVRRAFQEMRTALGFETEGEEPAAEPVPSSAPGPEKANPASEKEVAARQNALRAVFAEKLGISVEEEPFNLLRKERFSEKIANVLMELIVRVLENGVVANKEVLLTQIDKGVLLRDLESGTEQVILNLKKFYGPEQYKEMVRIVAVPLVKDFHPNLVPVVVDFAQKLIQPNVTLNQSETENRKKLAAVRVAPIPYQIKEGEMLLREGERVTREKLNKLRALNTQASQERLYERSFGALATLLCLIGIIYFLTIQQRSSSVERDNRDLLFLSVLLITFFFLPKVASFFLEALSQGTRFPIPDSAMIYGIPLAAGAMTVCLFMGMKMAVPFALVVTIGCAIIFQNRFEIFIYFFLSSIMGAHWMQNCKERKVYVIAGAKLGLLNMLLATAADAYMGELGFGKLLWNWAFAFSGGIASGILAAGIVPLLEMTFSYTTDITLLEMANLERPILRRLMLEAPGTYHHSVVVGSMVEAAASEIGANPVLAKVCGYYHDIGKIKKPLYFVENQTDGKNRHDKLAPSMSSLILISHVKDGVEIAKQNRLGAPIIDAIRQHHGTSLIKFFYEKARKLKGEDAVKIDNFRYPGPRPQTREAGLVMLADVVEAASRTLENPTPSRIQGHVQKLINSIFSDGQLDNCELTLKDLNKIAKSFNKILNGIHHHRIEYSDSAAGAGAKEKKEKKEKNGRLDPVPAAANGTKTRRGGGSESSRGASSENGTGHLKRLGVS